jgi:hypothetical protein
MINMKLITIKHSLLFATGLLLSFIIAVVLGFWKIEKQVDNPPVWPMHFGNITMRADNISKIGFFVHFSVGQNDVMCLDFRMPAKEINYLSPARTKLAGPVGQTSENPSSS